MRPTPIIQLRTGRWLWIVIAAVILAFRTEAEVSREQQIKAAYLYNFIKFVDWPATRFESESTPIVIGIHGKSSFVADVESAIKGRKINNREILVRNIGKQEDLRLCHLVFFGSNDNAAVSEMLKGLEGAGVLTVGEGAFVSAGGMIGFVLEGDKVRFEINAPAAEREGIRISGQLQKLAKPVSSR
jgi:hypothetical protein